MIDSLHIADIVLLHVHNLMHNTKRRLHQSQATAFKSLSGSTFIAEIIPATSPEMLLRYISLSEDTLLTVCLSTLIRLKFGGAKKMKRKTPPISATSLSLLQYLGNGVYHNRIFFNRVIEVRRDPQQARS